MSGPDMTPQALADAIDGLVADLPSRKQRVSDSWQRVLAIQIISRVLEGCWSEAPASVQLRERCLEANHAVSSALRQLLREQPALHQALSAAFDIDRDDEHDRTAFARTGLGQLLECVAYEHRRRQRGEHP